MGREKYRRRRIRAQAERERERENDGGEKECRRVSEHQASLCSNCARLFNNDAGDRLQTAPRRASDKPGKPKMGIKGKKQKKNKGEENKDGRGGNSCHAW